MGLHIIDNKKVEMTDDEWSMYQTICKDYDDPKFNVKGSDLFTGLFETNNEGIIIFLRPPSSKRTSFEVYLFLMSLMQHQHLRQMHTQIDDVVNQVKQKLASIK